MISSNEEQITKKQKILIFENSFTLTEHILKLWIEIAQQSVDRRNCFTAALSGGRTPMEFYCKLSNFQDFNLWRSTHIFLGDERFVPPNDSNSNFKMIRENLLNFINIPPENIHPITTNQENVELSAEQFKNDLSEFFEFNEQNAPCFDMILLGLGIDGHTASLFPDDDRVDDPNCLTLPVSLPSLKEERVSLTLPVINNARNVVMPVVGANKAEIVKKIINSKNELPASKVDLIDGQLTFLLDKDAAAKLPYHDSYSHEGQAIRYEM